MFNRQTKKERSGTMKGARLEWFPMVILRIFKPCAYKGYVQSTMDQQAGQ
jgi:hypothetical protein